MNYIVEFKRQLKEYQIPYRNLIKNLKAELELLEQLKNNGRTNTVMPDEERKKIFRRMANARLEDRIRIVKDVEEKYSDDIDPIIEKLTHLREFYYKIQSIVPKVNIEITHKLFKEYVYFTQLKYDDIQNVINAYENDKIKMPINDVYELLVIINLTDLPVEDKSKIFGLAIYFNSMYAKKNKKHNIENIEVINLLSEYYNKDGSFKFNENIEGYKKLLLELLKEKSVYDIPLGFNFIAKFVSGIAELYTEEFGKVLQKSNEQIKKLEEERLSKVDTEPKEEIGINRSAVEELKKYYKNGKIISIPKDLPKFYQLLEECGLDDIEKKYIVNLINDDSNNNSLFNILEYLSEDEQIIYKKSVNLLNSLKHSNSDYYVLVQNIEELQAIAEMLKQETAKENMEYLLSDVPTLIETLKSICEKHLEEFTESDNKLLFLCNKDTIPYIVDDINRLDRSYTKVICSLIGKIDKSNQASFRKIKTSEQMSYNMYEVTNPKAHVAFVEIDSGIYVIIGADVARDGYKELNNRLKSNQYLIRKMEESIKNPLTRNNVLKSNEVFLPMVSLGNDSVSKVKFLS